MKRGLLMVTMTALAMTTWAQHKVYRDDNNMITMTSQGDVTMICKDNNGQLKEQVSFINEKGVAPIATTFNDQGLPSSIVSNGEKINISYAPDGKTAYAQMVCKEGTSKKQAFQLNQDISGYHAPGLIGWLDANLSNVSTNYGKQLNQAAEILDKVGTLSGFDYGSIKKEAKWVDKGKEFLKSNKASITEQVLIGSGVTILETWDDMKSVIEGGISRGLIVGKTLLKVVGNYNSWKKSWSDFVYNHLDDMDFIDHLTYDEYCETMLMTGDEWEAYKKKMRAQWKEQNRKQVEENRTKFEGQELIEGTIERTRQDYDGYLISPDKQTSSSKGQNLVPDQDKIGHSNGNLIDP